MEFVPTAIENLLSVSAGVEDGFNVLTTPRGEITQLESQKTSFSLKVLKERGLYVCTTLCQPFDSSHTAGHVHKCSEYDLWHARLGHPDSRGMERLQKETMVKGIETSLSPCLHGHSLCEVCVCFGQAD